MAKIIAKKSTVAGKVPLPTDLEIGEIAVNTADNRIYTKHSDNSIRTIGTNADMLKSQYDSNNDGVVNSADYAASTDWSGILNVPATFPPSSHTHPISAITNLQTTLDDKEPKITKSTGYAKWNGSSWVFVNETYLQSYTETDPVFSASAASGITSTNISNWNTAFSWGNHATAGYQAQLVSGVNIKTINGNTLLGSGDLAIGGGSGSGDVVGPASSTANHLVTFADTTGKVIKEATYFDSPAVQIPPAPASGKLRWFAKSRGGRVLPHIIGPSGIDVALQPALFGNTVYMWLPGTGTTLAVNFGTSFVARNSGTGAAQAHPAKTSTNAITSLNRATFSTGTSATGSSGIQSSATVAWRGNAANLGGFFFFVRFGIETLGAGQQVLVGLSALNAALTGEPSAVNNTIAIGKDSGDTTWQLITRDTSTVTKINTNCTVTAGQILDFTAFAPPNGTYVTFRLVDAVTGTVYVDNVSVSTNLPSNTVFMYMHAQTRSTSGTTAKLLALNRMYLETDL